MLLLDIDECKLVDNNCTKGGANCTNSVGSFNCTCPTRYFWNGMKCEGLFTLVLFRSMWTSFQGVFLTIFLSVPLFLPFSLSLSLSLSLFLLVQCSLFIIILIIRLSVCLSFCLSVGLSAPSFVCLFIFPSARNSVLTLKRRNGISVSFSSCGKNSNGNDWRGMFSDRKIDFFSDVSLDLISGIC